MCVFEKMCSWNPILNKEDVYFLKKCVIKVVDFSILMINILSHYSKTDITERTYPHISLSVPWRCVAERSFLYQYSRVPYRIRLWTIRYWTTCPDLDYCRGTDRGHYAVPQSTYAPRVPQCLSPRPNWALPSPLQQARMPPLNQRGVHSPAGEGGGAQFRRLKKKPSTLSTLCAVYSVPCP